MSLTPGVELGSCEILAAIGAGGMGEVYRARDNKLGREVGIKVLPGGRETWYALCARIVRWVFPEMVKAVKDRRALGPLGRTPNRMAGPFVGYLPHPQSTCGFRVSVLQLMQRRVRGGDKCSS